MKRSFCLALILGAVSLAGCGGYAYYAPAPPPAIRIEARGVAPGPGYVWIDGYWGYRGRSYGWVSGRWERPPRARAVWEPGRWEQRNNRWAYRAGRWR